MVQQMMPMDIQGNAEAVASNRKQYKHIGKLKDSNANVAIVFRTIPDSPMDALVFGPKFLDDINHNSFQKVLESDDFNIGYNARTDSYENLISSGVIDPTLVVTSALRHATSAAINLLSISCTVTMADEKI